MATLRYTAEVFHRATWYRSAAIHHKQVGTVGVESRVVV